MVTCTGVGVAVVMLVCVGFVVSLIILGVMRVRNAKRCGGGADLLDDKQELDWDNSALTVTVNPMHPDVSSTSSLLVHSSLKNSSIMLSAHVEQK